MLLPPLLRGILGVDATHAKCPFHKPRLLTEARVAHSSRPRLVRQATKARRLRGGVNFGCFRRLIKMEAGAGWYRLAGRDVYFEFPHVLGCLDRSRVTSAALQRAGNSTWGQFLGSTSAAAVVDARDGLEDLEDRCLLGGSPAKSSSPRRSALGAPQDASSIASSTSFSSGPLSVQSSRQARRLFAA